MTTLRPSLREEWFIEDALRDLAGLCPMCRRRAEDEIMVFGASVRDGLSEIFKASRSIRVSAAQTGRPYRDIGDWEAASVIRTIGTLISAAVRVNGVPPYSISEAAE